MAKSEKLLGFISKKGEVRYLQKKNNNERKKRHATLAGQWRPREADICPHSLFFYLAKLYLSAF